MRRNALGAHALGRWLLVCPFFVIPNSIALKRLVEPTVGQPSNLWTVIGQRGAWSSIFFSFLLRPMSARGEGGCPSPAW
jgi:ABC-type Fe3+ transport system permease subunit